MTDELVRRRFAGVVPIFIDGNHGHGARGRQEWKRVTYGARRQPASVPCDPDVMRIERTLLDVGDHQHWSAGIEENPLRNDVVVAGKGGIRLEHDGKVVEPREGTD